MPGQARGLFGRAFHDPRRTRRGEERPQELVGQHVTRAHTGVARQKRRTGQRQVAQRIQHLVAHGLVGMAEAAGAENGVAIDDHRVVIGPAKRQARGMHRVHIRLTAEGAAVAILAHEAPVGEVRDTALATDRGIGEIDGEIHLQPFGGRQFRHRRAIGDHDLARHLDRVNARGLPLDARIEDAAHEGRGGAVEDRNLGAVDLDQRVVDAAAGQARP
jgi:hypothetical protein